MPYAVTLPLDANAADHIRQMWRALAEQAGADDAIRLGYVPHISLVVLPDEAPIPDVEETVSRAVEGWTTLSMVLAGFGIFPGIPPVIWAAPVVTAGLLACHASLCADLMPFGIHPHYRPEYWVPHVTLSQEGPSSARAIEILTSIWDRPVTAHLQRVELVRFRPVTVLRSHRLKSEK
jgi:2'-5' RNA ligase